jgi:1,4-dihydroxy-2-naphthoate octaprenyltransferase
VPRGGWRVWVLAARPATLSAAIVPVAVGTACAVAAGKFHLGPALGALFGAIFIQIGTNFANDVFDAEKGADTTERLGPMRAVQAGLLSPRQMRAGMGVVFGLAFLIGIYLVAVAGWPLVVIGLASIASGIAYTGGPYPLGYHGLGDLFVLVFFGFVAVCGTAYVQAGAVPLLAWWASVPVGALATAILVVNNQRDRVTDERAGKRTLAVRFGRGGAIAEWLILVAIAQAVPLLLGLGVVPGIAPSLWRCLPLVSVPLALAPAWRVLWVDGRELNPALGATARLLLVHGLLLAAGLALGPGR